MAENIVSPKQVKRPISKLETRRGPVPAGSCVSLTQSKAMSSETTQNTDARKIWMTKLRSCKCKIPCIVYCNEVLKAIPADERWW